MSVHIVLASLISKSSFTCSNHSRMGPPRVPLKHFHSLEITTVECLKSRYDRPSIIHYWYDSGGTSSEGQ